MILTKGYVYRIRTHTPPQKLQREHLVTYLGDDKWDARPAAGTQTFHQRDIVSIVPVRHNDGGNQGHYVNKVVR